MDKDPFEEYIRQTEPNKREKAYAWYTAMGLQKVDGLQTSEYLNNIAIKNIEGKISFDEAQWLVDSYYEESNGELTERTEEADKVTIRIVKLLSENAFTFSSNEYISIHRKLFQGVYSHAGKIRDYNISKKEWVLNGETVTYGSASELRATLDYDLGLENRFSYKGLTIEEVIQHLAFFVSRLWQIHIFGEGNTRTTAVFFIKYLRTLGFNANNDIFAENAWYFRNALVRANYTDLKKGIHETTEFLELFLRNLLMHEDNVLSNRVMHISGFFAKPDIENAKPDIESEKPDINYIVEYDDNYSFMFELFSRKTVSHIRRLYAYFEYLSAFGRTDASEVLDLKPSATSELIKKMYNAGIIEKVDGQGKGKYKFKKIEK